MKMRFNYKLLTVCLIFGIGMACTKEKSDNKDEIMLLLLLATQQAEVVDCPAVDVDLVAGATVSTIATFSSSLRKVTARWKDGTMSSYAASCSGSFNCEQNFVLLNSPNSGIVISADVMVEINSRGSCTVVKRGALLNEYLKIAIKTSDTKVYAIINASSGNGTVLGGFLSF